MKDIDRVMLEFGRNAYPAVVEVDGMTDEQLRAIQLLACAGLIESFGVYGGYRITNAGMNALRAEEDRLQHKEEKRAEEETSKQEERAYLDEQTKKQFRHDWRITIFSLIGGFILGVVSDHFLDIVGYLSAKASLSELSQVGWDILVEAGFSNSAVYYIEVLDADGVMWLEYMNGLLKHERYK